MRISESPIFGKVYEPEKFEELISLTLDPKPSPTRAVRMWRGQADLDWPIHSSAYRRLTLKSGAVDERAMQRYEKGLLDRATHRGFRQVEGRTLSDFDLLARLRHHGAATRLVDATRNALTALWFSVADAPDRVGALIGIHSDLLGGYEGEPEERTYEEVLKNLAKYDHPQTWEPPSVSPRVAAQHGQFLYSHVVDHPTGSLSVPKKAEGVLIVAIPPSLKGIFAKILSEVFDIRYETLFPDLDGFGFANSTVLSRRRLTGGRLSIKRPPTVLKASAKTSESVGSSIPL